MSLDINTVLKTGLTTAAEVQLRKEYYENQCEEVEGDATRCQVYENDGEMVANWWIAKINHYLWQNRKETVEKTLKDIESLKMGDKDLARFGGRMTERDVEVHNGVISMLIKSIKQ
jgi:hypothetical protein